MWCVTGIILVNVRDSWVRCAKERAGRGAIRSVASRVPVNVMFCNVLSNNRRVFYVIFSCISYYMYWTSFVFFEFIPPLTFSSVPYFTLCALKVFFVKFLKCLWIYSTYCSCSTRFLSVYTFVFQLCVVGRMFVRSSSLDVPLSPYVFYYDLMCDLTFFL